MDQTVRFAFLQHHSCSFGLTFSAGGLSPLLREKTQKINTAIVPAKEAEAGKNHHHQVFIIRRIIKNRGMR
jgi:hypothetical protein